MVKASHVLDRVLVLEMVRVTEAAAVAASKLIGRGDEKAADHAAVEAMRAALNTLDIDGTVVIGEGERDEAPMLFIGERVGAAQGSGPRIDIALDPLEGTTITAKAGANALAVLAIRRGRLPAQRAPTSIWTRSRSGRAIRMASSTSPGRRPTISARSPPPRAYAPTSSSLACSTGPRHEKLIAELRALGCGIQLIPDGDVAGVIAVTDPDTVIDSTWARGARPKACSPPPRCAASAASSRAGSCSATTPSAAAPRAGGSRTSIASTSSTTSPRAM